MRWTIEVYGGGKTRGGMQIRNGGQGEGFVSGCIHPKSSIRFMKYSLCFCRFMVLSKAARTITMKLGKNLAFFFSLQKKFMCEDMSHYFDM